MRARLSFAVAAAVGALALAACGSSKSTTSAASSAVSSAASSAAATGTSSASSAAVSTSSCGPKPGVAATGTPINIGAINTDQPGTVFTDIGNMTGDYFNCVNANGGINGHPVKFFLQTEQTQPAQAAAAAKKLVDSDHVVGIVGTSSIIECSINYKYWQSIGYNVLAAGIAPECYGTPPYADANMGPRYSSDGAVQYALTLKPSKIVFDQSNVPGTGYIAAGPAALAANAHVPITQLTENVPISDPNSVAIKEVNDAGPTGSVVLNFTPPEALVILQAAQKLGIEDHVKSWGCSTPCDTDFLAKTLGPKWNGKFFVNAELSPPDDTNSAAMSLYKAILAQYGHNVTGGIGSFSQMGFVLGKTATAALETIKGAYTAKSVNAAFEAIKNYNTGMLCQQWTFGNYPLHIPNNMDYTVTPSNGSMVKAPNGGCTLISAVDPQIAQYRKVAGTAPLDSTSG
jgi:branched-chain amino acid transport system substrate-binding protein